jgi:hypothetical protein
VEAESGLGGGPRERAADARMVSSGAKEERSAFVRTTNARLRDGKAGAGGVGVGGVTVGRYRAGGGWSVSWY